MDPFLRRVRPLLALVLATSPACKKGPIGGNPLGPTANGGICTSPTNCASDICVDPSPNSPTGFCTIVCKTISDCTGTGDFPDGCCVGTSDGTNTSVCAPSNFCSHGDAGPGEPCPTKTECASGLTCLYDATFSECSQPCMQTSDCGGIAQECCDTLSDGTTYCIIDNQCGQGSSGSTGTTGGSGTSGATGSSGTSATLGDAGPVTVELDVDGQLTAFAGGWEATVQPGADTLDAPYPGRNLQLEFPPAMQPGLYQCLDGGGSIEPDGGPQITGAFASVNDGTSNNFVGLLPANWANLVIPLACGQGLVAGSATDLVEEVDLDVQAFSPGIPKDADGGSAPGHITGSAYWRIRDLDAGSVLEVKGAFDVDIEPLR